MHYSKIIQKCAEISRTAHCGLIIHPLAVADIIHSRQIKIGRYEKNLDCFTEGFITQLECLALLHSCREDSDWFRDLTFDDFYKIFLEEPELAKVPHAYELRNYLERLWNLVAYVTHLPQDGYVNYIIGLSKKPEAVLVKLADLQHNLSDLKYGSRRDKYQLAVNFLVGKNVWEE